MPHAMTDAFSVDDTMTEAAQAGPAVAALRAIARKQHEAETPNERAMRAATAARATDPPGRQQG
jgi:hypothetical protein